jgi:hypothetical protein
MASTRVLYDGAFIIGLDAYNLTIGFTPNGRFYDIMAALKQSLEAINFIFWR